MDSILEIFMVSKSNISGVTMQLWKAANSAQQRKGRAECISIGHDFTAGWSDMELPKLEQNSKPPLAPARSLANARLPPATGSDERDIPYSLNAILTEPIEPWYTYLRRFAPFSECARRMGNTSFCKRCWWLCLADRETQL